jgi:hypothetical protein
MNREEKKKEMFAVIALLVYFTAIIALGLFFVL